MRIVILFGTQTGNSELVADELVEAVSKRGHEVLKVSMAKSEPGVFAADLLFVIVVSSYGEGDLPEKTRPFFAKLEAQRPDLSNVTYGVFALGDSKGHPRTYCFGPKKLDSLLSNLGATRIGEIECHDVGDKRYPDEHAVEWFGSWLNQLVG